MSAGFGSLASSAIPPVRDLGVFAALGALLCFTATFVLVPTLLGCFAGFVPRAQTASWWNAERARQLRDYLGRNAVLVILAGVLLGIGGMVGLMQLEVESYSSCTAASSWAFQPSTHGHSESCA